MKVFLLLMALSAVAPAGDTSTPPPEVASYIEERELCDHFRGEPFEGSTPEMIERREFIQESLEIYCPGTDRRLAALKKRHSGNRAVLSRLDTYEVAIEGPCQ